MAEFLGQTRPPSTEYEKGSGFDAMGKPVPQARRQAAYEQCKLMGIKSSVDAWTCVGTMANALERDEPYNAMKAGMVYLDLTGTYRLMAYLCTGPLE
jgi:hypothetical protein